MSVAWFQSRYDKAGPGRLRRRLHQLPARRASSTTPSSTRCSPATRSPSTSGRAHALFRRLPADRGDGRARPRDAAPRPDEAVRPHQSARSAGEGLRRRAAAPGQQARHAVQHGRLPDQAEARRAGAHLPHHSRAWSSAEFARLGGLHRNTFLNSPKLLDADAAAARPMPRLRFAGQITGCEGYVESAAIGLLAGRFAAAERLGEPIVPPPPTTAHGALLGHITGGHVETIDAGPRSFQPMNVNFGLFPPLAQLRPRRPTASGCAAPKRPSPESARSAPARSPISTWPGPIRPRDDACTSQIRVMLRGRLPSIERVSYGRSALSAIAGRWQAGHRAQAATCSRPSSAAASRPPPARSRRCSGGSTRCRGGAGRSRGILLARERRALEHVGRTRHSRRRCCLPARSLLVRGWIDGLPLHIAQPDGDVAYFRRAKAVLRSCIAADLP